MSDVPTQFRRHSRPSSYTVLANDFINAPELSFKQTGLLLYLLSKPDDWQVYIGQLAQAKTDGVYAVRTAINELIELGYMRREAERDKGKIVRWVIQYADYPKWVEATTGEPDRENRDVVRALPDRGNREVAATSANVSSATIAPDRGNRDVAASLVEPDRGNLEVGFPEVENRALLSTDLDQLLTEPTTPPVEHASVPDRRSGDDEVGTVSQLFDCGGLTGKIAERVAIDYEGETLWFDTPADAVYGLWRVLNGKRVTAVFSEKRRGRVEACLAVLGLSRCLDAVRGNTVSEFHLGDNDRGGRRFDDLAMIFATVDDAERFERYWTDPATRANGVSRRKPERRAPGQHHGPTGILPDVDAYEETARNWGKGKIWGKGNR